MKHLPLQNLHFIRLHKAFTERKQDEGKSKSHVESVSNRSREFLHFLEGQGISDIEKAGQPEVDAYFDYLQHRGNQRRAGGLSPAYLEKHREAVLRLMEYAKGVDIGQSGLFILQTIKDRVPQNVLTVEEVTQLFSQCEDTPDGIRNKAILSTLYGCGLRKGELQRLNVSDLNLANATLRVLKGKNTWQRDVPVAPRVLQYLEEYLFEVREFLLPEGSQETGFLLNNLGQRMAPEGIHHKVKTMAQQSGLQKPISAHSLRHAIATHLLDDFSLEEVALFLGHRNIDSTQVYTHVKHTQTPVV